MWERESGKHKLFDDIPTFKVFRESTGELIDMISSDVFEWSNNEVYNVELLSEHVLPESHMLLDAYPNPFNPVTSISFEISEYAHAELSIYNINGQLVEKIIDGKYDAGHYTYNWNANNYSSGIYFIKLGVDNSYFETKKVILIK